MICFIGVLVPSKSVTCGGGRVVIQCSLKLSTMCTGPVASQEIKGQPSPVLCLGSPAWTTEWSANAATWVGLGGTQKKLRCQLSLAAASASLGPHSEKRPDAASLRDSGKGWSMSQERLFVWKNHCKQLGWSCKVGVAGSQGITRVGQCYLGRWRLTYGTSLRLDRGGLRKGTMAFASTSVWGKAALLVLIL